MKDIRGRDPLAVLPEDVDIRNVAMDAAAGDTRIFEDGSDSVMFSETDKSEKLCILSDYSLVVESGERQVLHYRFFDRLFVVVDFCRFSDDPFVVEAGE